FASLIALALPFATACYDVAEFPDGSGGPGPDMAMQGQVLVGPKGGTVSLLKFGVTGDTRPGYCDDVASYPTDTITNIFGRMQQAGVQFAIATGDFQYTCNGGYAVGMQQLALYRSAAAMLGGKLVFPTMGNHECSQKTFCSTTGYTPANFRAYMDTLV